jgi:hypothetical protein
MTRDRGLLALRLVSGGVFVASVLAGDVVGAIIVSGIAKGEIVSLTLAPAELAAMLVLIFNGAGRYRLQAHGRSDLTDES